MDQNIVRGTEHRTRHAQGKVDLAPPTFNGSSSSKSTPLAETLTVIAAHSTLPAATTTGSASGNRTAQRTSCCAWDGAGTAGESDDLDFEVRFIVSIPEPKGTYLTLTDFFGSTQGTKVLRVVMESISGPQTKQHQSMGSVFSFP
jgi:hypothetical protein